MGIAGNEWGFQVGTLPKGARDKISDVPGVTVGHCTLADGVVQTGVTALLPHQGDVFHEKVLAAMKSAPKKATLSRWMLFESELKKENYYDY